MTAPSDTQLVLSQIMGNQHTNLLGTVHGGNIMKFVDDAAGAVSARFAQGPAVTAAMDEMLFLAPVRVGDVLTVKTQVNWAGRSSMEVGARVETTRWDDRTPPVHVATAFLVMVGVDESGRPRQVPTLEPVTEERRSAASAPRRSVASTASRSAPPSAISARVRRPSSAHDADVRPARAVLPRRGAHHPVALSTSIGPMVTVCSGPMSTRRPA